MPPLDDPELLLELPLDDPELLLDPPLDELDPPPELLEPLLELLPDELPEPEELPPSAGTVMVWPPHAHSARTATMAPSSQRMSEPPIRLQQLGCQPQ